MCTNCHVAVGAVTPLLSKYLCCTKSYSHRSKEERTLLGILETTARVEQPANVTLFGSVQKPEPSLGHTYVIQTTEFAVLMSV